MPEIPTTSAVRLPPGITPPESLLTPRYTLRPLTREHTAPDYEAVMETQERLRASAPNGWPRPGFTLEENRSDLIQHEDEFARRISYAYTMLDPDETVVLGCVYLNPPDNQAYEVDVHMWVREQRWAEGLAQQLHRDVDAWLRNVWHFSAIGYLRPDYYFARGSCLCGAVDYYAGPLRGPFELCHCNRCRRASGSAYVAGIITGEVRFVQGQALISKCSLPVETQPPAYRRIFCSRCGSLVPDPDQSGPQEIAAGSLTPMPVLPDRHIYAECAPGWAPVEGSLPRFTGTEIRQFRNSRQ